jgi:hypothetical protein
MGAEDKDLTRKGRVPGACRRVRVHEVAGNILRWSRRTTGRAVSDPKRASSAGKAAWSALAVTPARRAILAWGSDFRMGLKFAKILS